MKIIIPISSSDVHRATKHAQVLRKFGGLENYPIVYFATPSTADKAHEVARLNGATVAVMDVEPAEGWPIGPNQQFAAAVLWLGRQGSTSPFLWMELDMLPLRPGWAKALEDEYAVQGKAFMGNIVPFGMSRNGRIVYEEGDTMMMGCGVYPFAMDSDERIRWAILNLGKPAFMQPRINGHLIAFDVYLRHPMKAFGVADTKLIANHWNTGNYRQDDFGLHCDALPFDRPHRQRGGTVNPEAVLVHGCKDETLVDLLLGPPSRKVRSTEDWAKDPPSFPANLMSMMPEGCTLPVFPPHTAPAPAQPITPINLFPPTKDHDWPKVLDDLSPPPAPSKNPPPLATKAPIVPPAVDKAKLKADLTTVLADGQKRNIGDVAKTVGLHKERLRHLLTGLGFKKDTNSVWLAVKPKKEKK